MALSGSAFCIPKAEDPKKAVMSCPAVSIFPAMEERARVPRNPFQKPLGRVQHSPLSKNHSPEPGADHCACSPHTPWLPTQTHASGLSTVQSRPLTILSFSKAHLKSHLPKSNPAFSCLQSKLSPENTREKVDKEVFLSQQPCPKCKHRDRCVQLHTPQST